MMASNSAAELRRLANIAYDEVSGGDTLLAIETLEQLEDKANDLKRDLQKQLDSQGGE